MHEQTIQHYNAHSDTFAAQYRAAKPSALHALLGRWLPASGSVLEIGCGMGRDAGYMAGLGLDVVATDGSARMLDEARQYALTLPDDVRRHLAFRHVAFPVLGGDAFLNERFDAVVAVAILMHIPDPELFDTAFQIRSLLKPRGRFICSFCAGRECSATDPRLYVNREPGEVRLIFERLGFRVLSQEDSDDSLSRGIRWTTFVFAFDCSSGNRPVDQIEAIVNHDKKDATYKLALLRALCEIAQTAYRHVKWHPDETVSVPLGLVAEKWLYYYWPLIDTGQEPLIPQKRGLEINKPLAFRKAVLELASHFHGQNGFSRFYGEFQSGKLDAVAQQRVVGALGKIANTIVVGPVQFASQGHFRFTGTRSVPKACISPQQLYASLGQIHFDAAIWRELCLVGHWISEAIILRWAELTVEISRHQVPLTRVLEKLLIRPETERDVDAAKTIYRGQAHLSCAWTQLDLNGKRFDVDHAIPFSLWHNNDLWNLLPTDARVNNQKRDRLVSRETLLRSRDTVIACWQMARQAMPERFDSEINRTLFGRNFAETQWEASAYSTFMEAVETLAIQRGVERWTPHTQGAGFVQCSPQTLYPQVQSDVFILDGEDSAETYITPKAESVWCSRDGISKQAFVSALPLVASLAASTTFFDGFRTGNLGDLSEVDWIAVPPQYCAKNRFVIRVVGDSMEPLFHIGDWLVFEYHRTPRRDGQIVIAADFTSGSGEYAVKRFKAHPTLWRFLSENNAYAPVEIDQREMEFPILGTFVARVG